MSVSMCSKKGLVCTTCLNKFIMVFKVANISRIKVVPDKILFIGSGQSLLVFTDFFLVPDLEEHALHITCSIFG